MGPGVPNRIPSSIEKGYLHMLSLVEMSVRAADMLESLSRPKVSKRDLVDSFPIIRIHVCAIANQILNGHAFLWCESKGRLSSMLWRSWVVRWAAANTLCHFASRSTTVVPFFRQGVVSRHPARGHRGNVMSRWSELACSTLRTIDTITRRQHFDRPWWFSKAWQKRLNP